MRPEPGTREDNRNPMPLFSAPTPATGVQDPGVPATIFRMPRSEAGRLSWLLALLILLVCLTRWPLQPPQLYSFDSVNLALALRDFDPTRNQPQPPGYPLFVVEARLFHYWIGSPETTFFVLRILVTAISLAVLFLVGRLLFSARVGWIAAALFLMNPVLWFSGLTSALRPHLALLTLLVAYFCWRAMDGKGRYFYAASLALGLGGGFRPELSVVLLPLWAWAGWRCGRLAVLLRGALILVASTVVWIAILVLACGGFAPMYASFRDYLSAQTFQTSIVLGEAPPGWRRMVGRAIVWNALGALPWLWALPLGWFRREEWTDWKRKALFVAVWFLPAFLFQNIIHIADPDHALTTIPVVCLIGGVCLSAAEQRIGSNWNSPALEQGIIFGTILLLSVILLSPSQIFKEPALVIWIAVLLSLLWFIPLPEWRGGSLLVSVALLGNILLFFGQFPFPQGPSGGSFRGLASVKDAFLGGIYESSYNRVRWVSEMTSWTVQNLPAVKASAGGPLLLIWFRDGEPVWRKLAFYFPSDKVYVLDEAGDPGVPVSQARIWYGNKVLARYSGKTPIRLPIPKGARLVWFMAGGKVSDLGQIVPVHKIATVLYSDFPAGTAGFRWGSFEFVPQ